MSEREDAEHNAVAWLSLTDDELVERSASVGLPDTLRTEVSLAGAVKVARPQVGAGRLTADSYARDLAGDAFVDAWISENRKG